MSQLFITTHNHNQCENCVNLARFFFLFLEHIEPRWNELQIAAIIHFFFRLLFTDHWPKFTRFFGRARAPIIIRATAKGQWPKWVYNSNVSVYQRISIGLMIRWSIYHVYIDTAFRIFNVRVNHNQKARSQRSTESNIVNLEINDEPGDGESKKIK